MNETVLMLRTCDADMRGLRGLVWPERGPVRCNDWSPLPQCGNGLHGLPGGVGYSGYLDWTPGARWLVFEARAAEVVGINGFMAKAPRGHVVYCGDRIGATLYLLDRGCPGPIVGAMVTVGDQGVAVAGDWGTATAGHHGTATAGHHGTATAGVCGTATAGYGGTATAGHDGTATAGDYGTATVGYGGMAAAGEGGKIAVQYFDGRYRLAVGYVGEDGIEPNVLYRVRDGRLVPVEEVR